ncbi:MAG: hypothetical protein JKX86_02395 [Verrucomicrobiales bacterium]|nr:hypothetical protein [Verrucomicrobiales bacterium]
MSGRIHPSTAPRPTIRPQIRRKRSLQIDLNSVPSSMEQLAESWKGNR